jgi:hypothetical protein
MSLIWGISALLLLTSHKYWALNYWTFLGLSAASLWLASDVRKGAGFGLWCAFAALAVLSAFYNLGVLGKLTRGSASYKNNYEKWCAVLSKVAPSISTDDAN